MAADHAGIGRQEQGRVLAGVLCHHQVVLQTRPWAVTSCPASRFVQSAKPPRLPPVPGGAVGHQLTRPPPCLSSSGYGQTRAGGSTEAWEGGREGGLAASHGLYFRLFLGREYMRGWGGRTGGGGSARARCLG